MKKLDQLKTLPVMALLLVALMGTAHGQTVSMYAVEDASVTSLVPDSTILGKDPAKGNNMFAWRNPQDTVYAFLRFDISKFAGYAVTNATFSVGGAQYLGATDYMLELYGAGGAWSEDTVTWNNQPNIGGTMLAERDLSNSSARRDFAANGEELIKFINDKLSKGDQYLNLALKSAGTEDNATKTDDMWIGSSEDGSYAPQLVLTLGGKKMYAVEDASVTSLAPDSTILGKDPAKGNNIFAWRNAQDTVYAFLRFDISQYAGYTVSSANFSVRGAQYLGATDYMLELYGAGAAWSEDTVTWNNQPNIAGTLLAERDLSNSSARRDFVANGEELINFINGKLAKGDAFINFAIKSAGTEDNATKVDDMWIGSSEDGSYAPQLELVFSKLSMYGAEDASVTSASPDSTILGKDPAKGNNIFAWRNPQDTVYAFLRFDISQYAGYKASNVMFSVRGAQYLGATDYMLELYGAGAAWSEDTVTWNNQPNIGGTLLAERDLSNSSARRDFVANGEELLKFVNGKLASGDAFINFAIKSAGTEDNATKTDDMWIGSSEDGSYGPQLVFAFEVKPQTPVLSPAPGEFLLSVDVDVVNQPPADTVYYTIAEGGEPADPDRTSDLWPEGGITISATSTVKVAAFQTSMSDITTATYTIIPVAPVTFSPSPVPKYQPPIEVTLATQPEDAVIRYSDDGSEPTTLYTEPIVLTQTTTIKVQAFSADFTYSTEVAEATYTVIPPAGTEGTGPGGVGFKDLTKENQPEVGLWLKPDMISGATDGGAVLEWPDASGNDNLAYNTWTDGGDNAIPNTAESQKQPPIYRADVLNGQPVLEFGMPNTDQTLGSLIVDDADNLDGGEGNSLLMVVKRNDMFDNFAALFQKRDVRGDASAQAYVLEMNGGDDPNTIQWVVTRDIFVRSDMLFNADDYYLLNVGLNGTHHLAYFLVDGRVEKTTAYSKPILATDATLIIGGFQAMNMAEAIYFNSTVNAAQTRIVHEYLAAKYGLSLTDGSSTINLYTNTAFATGLIGIGQEADLVAGGSESHLHATGGGLELKADGFAADGDYVLAAHDGSPLATDGAWSRTWYVQTAGNGGTVQMVFDFERAGLTLGDVSQYQLHFSADDPASMTDLGLTATADGNKLVFTVENVADGYYTVGMSTGLGENILEQLTGVAVYPNPARELVTVSLRNELNGEVEINIYDLSGKKAISTRVMKSGEWMQQELDLGTLERGYYMIEVQLDGNRYMKGLVKQ